MGAAAGERTCTRVVKSGYKSRPFLRGSAAWWWRNLPFGSWSSSVPLVTAAAGPGEWSTFAPNETNFLRELSCELGVIIILFWFCGVLHFVVVFYFILSRRRGKRVVPCRWRAHDHLPGQIT